MNKEAVLAALKVVVAAKETYYHVNKRARRFL